MSTPAGLGRGHIIPNNTRDYFLFVLENSWSVPGLEPPDGNPFHALIGVHPEEEEKESDEEEEDLEEDIEVIMTLGRRRWGPSHCRSRDPDVGGVVIIIIVFSCCC